MPQDHVIKWALTPDHPDYGGEIACEQYDYCRDASGEVQYYDEDTAVAEAMRKQDKTTKLSFTVECRP